LDIVLGDWGFGIVLSSSIKFWDWAGN